MADSDNLVKRLVSGLEEAQLDRPRLDGLDDVSRGIFTAPFLPASGASAVEREYAALVPRSELAVLGLVVTAVTSRLRVEGFRAESQPLDQALWDIWQASSLDSRQPQLYWDALVFGDAYMSVTRGEDGVSVMRPESPLALSATHDPLDPLRVTEAVKRVGNQAWLYDAEAIYYFTAGRRFGTWTLEAKTPHRLGVCPIARFPNLLDSLGRSTSEMNVALPAQRRINQSIFTRLLLEAHTAWRQRWISGIDVERDGAGNAVPPFRMGVDKLLMAPDPDTKFGEFQASSTADLLRAVEEDMRHIAVVTQTPPTMLAVTSISNISQDTVAALDAGFMQKVDAKQALFGEAHEYAIGLAARLMGRELDPGLETVWADMELRSLAQRADAFGKLQAGGLPMRWLLESVLGLTVAETERTLADMDVDRNLVADAEARSIGIGGVPSADG